jgi:hypothetical protein
MKNYTILGILKSNDLDEDDLNYLLNIFNKVKDKIFSFDELNLIEEKLGIELKKYFAISNGNNLNETNTNHFVEFRIQNIIAKNCNKLQIEKLEGISTTKFYKRVDIENLSAEFGFDVYSRLDLKNFLIQEIKIGNDYFEIISNDK